MKTTPPKWKAVLNAALKMLGLSEFTMKEGKLDISAEQRTQLESTLGKGIVEAIEKHNTALEEGTANTEDLMSAEDFKALVDAQANEVVSAIKTELERKIDAQRSLIETLSASTETDITPKPGAAKAPNATLGSGFKVDMGLYHNRLYQAQIDGVAMPIAADSIDIADLKTEFGLYIKGEKRNIIRKLTQKSETMQFMTTVQTEDSVWKAAQASISHVVQQFVASWTPLGKAKFTPIAIPQRRHKINVPVTPADVIGSWLGMMYDEGKSPKDMPLVQYVIDLIIEKALEDRELLQVMTGEFVEITEKPESGTTGQDPEKSVDGLLTILRKQYEDPDSAVHFVKLGVITEANVVDKMKAFRKALPRVLQRKPMDSLMSQDLYALYKDAYQTEFPNTKNDDAKNDMLDFSLIKMNPVASLSGLMSFFVTPKDNLIRLRDKNDVASTFRMQEQDYEVKIFSEWSEAYGFAVAEAIVAYIDPIWVVDLYAKKEDASKLQAYMLTDAGCTDVDVAELAGYKAAIVAAGEVPDLDALQAIVDAVNAA